MNSINSDSSDRSSSLPPSSPYTSPARRKKIRKKKHSRRNSSETDCTTLCAKTLSVIICLALCFNVFLYSQIKHDMTPYFLKGQQASSSGGDSHSHPIGDDKTKIMKLIQDASKLLSNVNNIIDGNGKGKNDDDVFNNDEEDNDKVDDTDDTKINDKSDSEKDKDKAKVTLKDKDKAKVIKILRDAKLEITPEIERDAPTWSEVKSLYGSKPVILGLDQCSKYQQIVPETDRSIGGAGMFNTGTNLMGELLMKYCVMPKRVVKPKDRRIFRGKRVRIEGGMLVMVPWGKHNPVSLRTHHLAKLGGPGITQRHVLPVVMIKDPYHWMGSMCRHNYAAKWYHNKHLCPNLVMNKRPNSVSIRYTPETTVEYDSLVGLWNDWYNDYLKVGHGNKEMDDDPANSDFPFLMIRFEDILFHTEEVVTQVCKCGGGTLINNKNGIVLDGGNAKASHRNGSNGLLGAILRYGKHEKRIEFFSKEDVSYAKDTLDKHLMDLFKYSNPISQDYK